MAVSSQQRTKILENGQTVAVVFRECARWSCIMLTKSIRKFKCLADGILRACLSGIHWKIYCRAQENQAKSMESPSEVLLGRIANFPWFSWIIVGSVQFVTTTFIHYRHQGMSTIGVFCRFWLAFLHMRLSSGDLWLVIGDIFRLGRLWLSNNADCYWLDYTNLVTRAKSEMTLEMQRHDRWVFRICRPS